VPSWQRFAAKFTNPEHKPLFSVMLVDGGGPQVDREALAALPFPVTFALDATAPDTAMAAALYRKAGHEVVLSSDGLLTAYGLTSELAAVQSVPVESLQALGQLWPSKAKALSERAALQEMIGAIKAQGQAFVLWESEESLAAQMVQREQIAHALVFRRLDGAGESISVMRRYLDRAAFKAVQDGGVLVAGNAARAETLAALLEWSVEGRAATIALAPLSALLDANFKR